MKPKLYLTQEERDLHYEVELCSIRINEYLRKRKALKEKLNTIIAMRQELEHSRAYHRGKKNENQKRNTDNVVVS